MQFLFEKGKLNVQDDDGKWLGDIAFPFVDEEKSLAVIERVFVRPEARGIGLAGKMMQVLVDHAEKASLQFKLMCPYAKAWFAKHPEKQHLLPPADRFQS